MDSSTLPFAARSAVEFVASPVGPPTIALAALVGWLCWAALYPVRRWQYRSFPGPLGLPFLGNLLQIVKMDPTHFMSYVGNKYGPICKVWFGTRPWLVVSDPDLVRKLAGQCTARPPDMSSYFDVLTGENRQVQLASAFFANGEAWHRGRRVFEASIIHPASLAGHLPTILRVLGRFVPSLSRPASSGAPLDAQKAVGDLMLAIVGEMAYGVDFEVDFYAEDEQQQQQKHRQRPGGLEWQELAGFSGCGSGSGGLGAPLARFCRSVFESFQLDNATAYLPLQLAFPALAPAIRWLADLLPDANQRRSMAARTALAAISRQLMAQWAAAKQQQQQQQGSVAAGAEGPRATVKMAAAEEGPEKTVEVLGEEEAQEAGVAVKVEVVTTATNVAAAVGEGKVALGGANGAANGRDGGQAFREVGSGISASSFMAAMLEGRKRAGVEERLSDIEVIGQSITFILAAYETSSTTTSLALLLLATHPEAQARMLAEVDATEGREITQELLAELPYTDAVLKETLRLYPAVPMMHRHAKTDIKLPDGRVIPSGTFLALPSYNLHHDPALWPEPERFMPERFLTAAAGSPTAGGGAGRGGAHPHPAAWAGFGLGARMCVGYKLATMIGKATLVSLLRRYTFIAAPGQAQPPRMATGLTYGPQGGVWLQLHAR